MNKNVKRILALTLIINVYSVVEPTKYVSLTNTEVQAGTTSIYLKSLSINKADLDFDSDKTNYSVNVDDSVNEVKITAKPKSDDSEVRINDDIVDSSENYRKTIDLDDGENVIKIIVENADNKSKTYTLNITRGKSNAGDVYLSYISLSQGNINFQKETGSYDVSVKSDTDKITIKAKPEDNNDRIKIDGSTATEGDGYTQTVYLEKGKNEIIVEVENKKEKKRSYKLNITRQDDSNGVEVQDNIYLDFIKLSDGGEINISKPQTSYDVKAKKNTSGISIHAEPESNKYMVEINGDAVEESKDYTKDDVRLHEGKNEIKIKIEDLNNKKRIYTLNIYVGDIPIPVSNSINTTIKDSDVLKTNQWVQLNNNNWQYNDSMGDPLKDTWFYDMNKWYYLDSEGIMKTGWIRDVTGKYYYLQSNGSMVKNTTVEGYKIGSDGAWIR